MPTSVSELFGGAKLSIDGGANWSKPISDERPGVYVVSLSRHPDDKKNSRDVAPIDLSIVQKWISNVPTLKLDGSRPTPEALKERLSKFWFPDEVVLYIGKTNMPIKKRVGQYYRHQLGKPRPHAGGHWIKTLSILNKLSLFWGHSDDPYAKETGLLKFFVENVSEKSKSQLHDPDHPFPFANLEFPKGNKKKHGIIGSVNRLPKQINDKKSQ